MCWPLWLRGYLGGIQGYIRGIRGGIPRHPGVYVSRYIPPYISPIPRANNVESERPTFRRNFGLDRFSVGARLAGSSTEGPCEASITPLCLAPHILQSHECHGLNPRLTCRTGPVHGHGVGALRARVGP